MQEKKALICLQCRRPGFNLPSQEDPLEKAMATDSHILAGAIPLIEEPGGLQSMGSLKSQTLLTTNNKMPKRQ